MKTEQKYEIIDNVKGISKLPDKSIDLTVTSPPYDNLRLYNGYLFDFKTIAKELNRVTKDGGVVVWVVGDQTNNGSESGTSFEQALYFKDIGFNLHDTMIWYKPNPTPTDPICNRYYNSFEYMFILSKGKPKTCNYLKDKSKSVGKRFGSAPMKRIDGTNRDDRTEKLKHLRMQAKKIRSNVWVYNIGSSVSSDSSAHNHPAIFPEELAKDHILSWSNEGDWVLDPFLGSGTTLKMCMETNRNGIGFEINDGYENIIKERLKLNHRKLDAFNTSS